MHHCHDWNESFYIWTTLQTFTGIFFGFVFFCKILQGFAKVCMILQHFARYGKIPQYSKRFFKILHGSVRFFEIWKLTKFCAVKKDCWPLELYFDPQYTSTFFVLTSKAKMNEPKQTYRNKARSCNLVRFIYMPEKYVQVKKKITWDW